MTQIEAFNIMRTFENEMGEDFIEQNESIVDAKCMLFWMRERGYLEHGGLDKYNAYLETINLQTVLYEKYFSLLKGTCHDANNVALKCLEVLAEFMCTSKTYTSRLEHIANIHLNCNIDDFSHELYEIKKLSLEDLKNGSY